MAATESHLCAKRDVSSLLAPRNSRARTHDTNPIPTLKEGDLLLLPPLGTAPQTHLALPLALPFSARPCLAEAKDHTQGLAMEVTLHLACA